jgi:beta-lactamase class D
MKLIIAFSFLILAGAVTAQELDSLKIAKMFGNDTGGMIIYSVSDSQTVKYNADRCAQRFLPASTFKIPNSLIAVETGIASDENFTIKWDGITRQIPEWNRDHTLASAMKYSVVPYYQEISRKVGRTAYEKYLVELKYGNQKVGNMLDRFWLDNSLKISLDEQMIFLKNFYNEKLPFSKRSIGIVKSILSSEKYDNSVLRFKTGTGEKEDETFVAWLVGYVETDSNTYLFVFNCGAKTFPEAKELRDNLPRQILKELRILR